MVGGVSSSMRRDAGVWLEVSAGADCRAGGVGRAADLLCNAGHLVCCQGAW